MKADLCVFTSDVVCTNSPLVWPFLCCGGVQTLQVCLAVKDADSALTVKPSSRPCSVPPVLLLTCLHVAGSFIPATFQAGMKTNSTGMLSSSLHVTPPSLYLECRCCCCCCRLLLGKLGLFTMIYLQFSELD